ncbi:NAD-dependent protein deacetylase sirtuin-3 isoform X2 [Cherax quadricarinatus]|uniref:NAD-dependent protein deacetylase sirtuin-3 isoform X2 n=1 Tax=Cherax quadricarinatus TaxID=27406 RepID=UPI00237814A9|nr:NAD-dependent protein deacetylase sirtuin-3-like isoform X2 [Cherax quadricarinatus]
MSLLITSSRSVLRQVKSYSVFQCPAIHEGNLSSVLRTLYRQSSTFCVGLPCCRSSCWSWQCDLQSSRHIGLWSSHQNTPTLKTVTDVAKFIKERATNVLVMVGAGISTPSGIPDFRTPGTGLYDNLQKYNLPYPEAIFDIHFFMMDPRPFFALAQDLYPGVNYKPNVVHHFLRLLYEEEKLQMVYTQNIDGLERLAGIPDTKLMEAHGTFATASCTLCGKMHNSNKVKQAIIEGDIPMCEATNCKGKVKPDIVFFGENLPPSFWDYHQHIHFTDLLLIIGTSLEVYPFAGIADAVGTQTPRVLINLNAVGSLGRRTTDVILTGDLEESVHSLVRELGWEEKLKALEKVYENIVG